MYLQQWVHRGRPHKKGVINFFFRANRTREIRDFLKS